MTKNLFSDNAGALGELDNFGYVTERKARYRVGTTVIYGYAAGGRIVQGGAGEAYVGHVAGELVWHLRRDEVGPRTVNGLPGLV